MGLLSLLPASALRALRKVMLRQGRRMGVPRMLALSKANAIRTVARAAKSSKAYGVLLREHGINPTTIGQQAVWNTLPVLTKATTFGRFSLAELSRDVPAAQLADVLTSSGRGGRSFGFRLTARKQHEEGWFDIDLGLQDVFGVDETPTLLVNCLPMGVVFRSRAVTVANVSVREDMACSILRDVGPQFGQTVVCTDPLFIRQLLAEGKAAGVDWVSLKTSVIVGEEMLVEAQRDYIAARMGIDLDNDSHRLVGSSFGVGELGLNLLFETRETIRIRRSLRANPAWASALGCEGAMRSIPSIFCYNPLRCFVEVLNPGPDGFGELCITMLDPHAIISLPRFTTGDVGRLLSEAEAAHAAHIAGTDMPWLPLIAVRGRMQDRPTDMPSVEAIKELLYLDHGIADQLTGAFRLARGADGRIELALQASSSGAARSLDLHAQLAEISARRLPFGLKMKWFGPDDFPWRPMLDFERKFAYAGYVPPRE